MTEVKTAVLLIGHGGVETEAEIPDFVKAIRRGRPTPQAIIDEVVHRYRAIGGSPLAKITRAQASALEARLGVRVAVANRMCVPHPKDVLNALAAEGVRRVVSLPLAPYSVSLYNEVAREACLEASLEHVGVSPYFLHPLLIEAFAEVVEEKLGSIEAQRRETTHVVMSAHSLPTRVIAGGDTYEREVRSTAAAVAARLRLDAARTRVAFQSQGMDGGDWLGPDLVTSFTRVAESGGTDVLVAAIGFLADHTEILYDLDIEAKAQAEARGLVFHRSSSLDVRDKFIDALAAVARESL